MILALPLIPFVAAFILLLIPSHLEKLVRGTACLATLLCLGITLTFFFSFHPHQPGFQFVRSVEWFPELGIRYQAGLDGINLTFCLLHALVAFASILIAVKTSVRLKEYLFYALIFIGSVFAVFTVLNVFFLYFFYEMTLLPLFLMLGIGGTPALKEKAGLKIALYMTLGGMLGLFAILLLYNVLGPDAFDITQLKFLAATKAGLLTPLVQKTAAAFLILGFGIMTSLWPFHSWSPSGYAAMPTPLAMLHAGVKIGPYVLIRIALTLLPAGFQYWAPTLSVLAVIGLIYAGFAAIFQKDLKQMGAFSSISHMGYIFLAFAVMSPASISAAVFLLFAHGLMAACFFALVGHLFSQTQESGIHAFGGLGKSLPFFSVCLMLTCMASAGIPGFANFPGELMIFISCWKTFPFAVIAAVLTVLITAIYLIRAVQAVCFGPENLRWQEIKDILTLSEKTPYLILLAALLYFGFFPTALLSFIQPAVEALL